LLTAPVVLATCLISTDCNSPAAAPTSPTTQVSGCALTVPSGQSTQRISSTAGTVSFPITANSGCLWQVQSASSFLSVATASGSGNGTARVDVSANTGAARQGTVLLASPSDAVVWAVLTVSQDAVSSTPPTVPSFLWFTSTAGDPVGFGLTRLFVPLNYIIDGTSDRQNLRFTMLDQGKWALDMTAKFGDVITQGVTYTVTGNSLSTSPSLDFSGEGWGCTPTAAHFTVVELQYSAGPNPSVQRLHVIFDQTCGVTPPLMGQLWVTR
jgi:hypothetical protein